MPIYEYECENCGNHLEELQKFSDAPLTKCPSCGKTKLHRLVSHTSFQLKGGGWYVTDFKDKPKKNGKSETKVETSKTETKSTPKTEASSESSKKQVDEKK